MIVMKFGGTSVGSRERMARVAELVTQAPERVVVVTSAMSGVTDGLIELGKLASEGQDAAVRERCVQMRERHQAAACDAPSLHAFEAQWHRLENLLQGLLLLREQTPRSRAMLAAFGERMAVELLASAIRATGREAVAIDAARIVVTDAQYLEAWVDEPLTRTRVRENLLPLLDAGVIPVVTGFVGATPEGVTTLLGRGGSDDSAALLGACLDADAVWIWTDVPGILSADPRVVPDARAFSRVSYREAAEMSYFGAKVVHPKTMWRVDRQRIPLVIRSTFAPELAGTTIGQTGDLVPYGVKTVTSMTGLSLVSLEGRGLAGARGAARRMFSAAETSGTNVVMISQASSEQAVSLVVRGSDVGGLVAGLREAFAAEIASGLVQEPHVLAEVCVLSAVGEGMAGVPGTSARFFNALGRADVNVHAIAQGASELSISVAISGADAKRAVRAVHAAFGLTRAVDLAILGHGRVAQALLRMLEGAKARLAAEQGLDLRVIAVADSRRFVVVPEGIALSQTGAVLEAASELTDHEDWLRRIDGARRGSVVVVDLTASDTTALHLSALEHAFHVVTANKLPLSGAQAQAAALLQAARENGVKYGFETTFGAGLPVLHALNELLITGDEILEVRGCLSGTLGQVCTWLDDGIDLATAVERARQAGFTEPDPREDLSGRDVVRKALIIARALGLSTEPDEVVAHPFLEGLEAPLDQALAAHGPALQARVGAARAEGQVLRYIATIASEGVRVSLESVPVDSPEGSLHGPDNLIVFRTARYREHPLIVRGPGAGADVTAAGVLGDIVRAVTIA